MSRPSRSRRSTPQPQVNYAAVPQSPPSSHTYSSSISHQQQHGQAYYYSQQPMYNVRPQHTRTPSISERHHQNIQDGRGATAAGVARGQIGAGYGPYSYQPEHNRDAGVYGNSRFASAPSSSGHTVTTHERPLVQHQQPQPTTNTVPTFLWDKDPDLDDALHNPDARGKDASPFTIFSLRGWFNAGALVVLVVGLIILFAGYPVIHYFTTLQPKLTTYNIGGINASGQIPDFPGMPSLIDSDTPRSAYSRTGNDGKKYNLVFSDEFNRDGRTFYPGEDPYWEAVDLHYWPTGDLEWYDPSAVTTKDGNLVITLTEQRNHDLNFMSGMLSSWNKICFTTGYIEVSISLPGDGKAPGYWPAAWTLGNLGRAGYGATTEGMWPYSYDTCDLGTFPNQTATDGTPTAAATGGTGGGPLSYLPGQKLSACTCPGSDHPGPSTSNGRGVPEIDIIEAEIDLKTFRGEVSQSAQIAPYNIKYEADLSGAQVFDESVSSFNSYKGSEWQQAVSSLSYTDPNAYGGNGFSVYGYEWWSDQNNRADSFVTWYSSGKPTWKLNSAGIGADPVAQIGPRLISEEPMYVILNLGIAPSFQRQDYKNLKFPAQMLVDYVRIYQRQGVQNGLTCDPPSHPTTDYINKHMNAYTNPNLTVWADAGYTFPRNSKYTGC